MTRITKAVTSDSISTVRYGFGESTGTGPTLRNKQLRAGFLLGIPRGVWDDSRYHNNINILLDEKCWTFPHILSRPFDINPKGFCYCVRGKVRCFGRNYEP